MLNREVRNHPLMTCKYDVLLVQLNKVRIRFCLLLVDVL